jgi:hypothetical protein
MMLVPSRALIAACGCALLAGAAVAQTASAAKKELVAKVLQLQQPGIEAYARALVEQPALQLAQQANAALQRIPADKREALAKEVRDDLKKFVDESVPILRERATKLAPTTVGTVLEEKLSEDELKQVIALLESPANKKFMSLQGEMQRALTEKLFAETRASVEPKVQALQQSLTKRFRAAAPAGNASAPGK